MPATQTVEFFAAPSQTMTAKLFAAGSDTQVASVTATEATNRKGVYTAAYTDVAAGTYRVLALVGTTPVASWWVNLTLTTATFVAYEVPLGVFNSGDATQATLLQVKAKTDLITAGQVQIVSPVGAGGNITTPIFAGDDYKASNGRAFEWTIDARTGFSAGTATCRFGGSSEETGDSWGVAGTVSDIGGGEWKLSFDLTKAVTSTLSPGFYRWSVELVNPGGDEVTEVYNSNANRQAEVRAKQT